MFQKIQYKKTTTHPPVLEPLEGAHNDHTTLCQHAVWMNGCSECQWARGAHTHWHVVAWHEPVFWKETHGNQWDTGRQAGLLQEYSGLLMVLRVWDCQCWPHWCECQKDQPLSIAPPEEKYCSPAGQHCTNTHPLIMIKHTNTRA